MKFTVATIAALLGAVAAAPQADPNSAVVINNCTETIYVQSFPYDGSAAGPLFALKNGQRFAEGFRPSGSTIKIAKDKALTKPLQFGYSTTAKPNYAYYEFNNVYGNPFADQHNILNPGDGCEKFDCKANDKNCYSNAAMKKVRACPKPVALFAKVCA